MWAFGAQKDLRDGKKVSSRSETLNLPRPIAFRKLFSSSISELSWILFGGFLEEKRPMMRKTFRGLTRLSSAFAREEAKNSPDIFSSSADFWNN